MIKSSFRQVPIEKLVSKVSTWNPVRESPRDQIDYIDISSIDRERKQITGTTTLLGINAPSRARQIVKAHDILVATVRPNLNAVAYVTNDFDQATGSTGFCVLRPQPNQLDSHYLFHWVRTSYFVEEMVLQATGASYPAVTDNIVKSSTIPLPPLAEQKRLARILDVAAAVQAQRRATLTKLDALLQSTFLHLFGDPVTNPMRWSVKSFDEVCETRLGKMLDAKQQTGQYLRPYLRNVNVQWNRIDLDDLLEMDFDEKEREKFQLRDGDVMICEGGEVGRAAIWREQRNDCYFQKALHRARPNQALVLPEYVLFYMWFMAKNHGLKDHTTAVTIAHLTGIKLARIPIPIPPVKLQRQFQFAYDKVERLKKQLSSCADKTNNLFQSLQQRAFRGQLSPSP